MAGVVTGAFVRSASLHAILGSEPMASKNAVGEKANEIIKDFQRTSISTKTRRKFDLIHETIKGEAWRRKLKHESLWIMMTV